MKGKRQTILIEAQSRKSQVVIELDFELIYFQPNTMVNNGVMIKLYSWYNGLDVAGDGVLRPGRGGGRG